MFFVALNSVGGETIGSNVSYFLYLKKYFISLSRCYLLCCFGGACSLSACKTHGTMELNSAEIGYASLDNDD